MINAENITKSYGDIKVLKGINLDIRQAEIVSIVGRSGAGKSTLLHILGTLDVPDTGRLIIKDALVSSMKEKELAKFRNKHIGFVFQFHHLLMEFTAIENVCIPAMIAGTNDDQLKKRAAELLKYLGLDQRMEHKPNQLSGGEAQRVAIARALINNPDVVFADEPTGNLDKTNSDELHKLFIQLRNDFRQTFVIVTHNPELAAMSDRMITIEDGYIKNT